MSIPLDEVVGDVLNSYTVGTISYKTRNAIFAQRGTELQD